MTTETSFGEWLKNQRKRHDLTQEALAGQIGCSRDTVRKVEMGIRRPSRQMAALIAERLHIPDEQRDAFMLFARSAGEDLPPHLTTPFTTAPIAGFGSKSSLRLSPSPLNNLPAPLTPFIGREMELEKLSALILRDGVRMVTLTGPGGTGKTRLALRVANGLLEHFDDGVLFVPLASISDPDLVVPAVADTLGLREGSGRSILQTLKRYLGGKQILLLLDNFEQVIEASPAVAEVLAASPGLKVLVTSRELLDLQSEYNFPVPPLGIPDIRYRGSIERLAQYEAVRLFIERSVAVKPDFAVTNDNAPAVADICVRLDGLPLAIELAAARTRVMSPQAIIVRLQDRLKLLTGGARDLPTRHQTLRNTIGWSYDLLDKTEKQLFRQLAVFQGGARLDAAEAVCNAASDLPALPDTMESLVSKSLLRREEGTGGISRFQMLETIHEYALEKLVESGEEAAVRRYHALYFMALAEEAEPQVKGSRRPEWIDRVEEERGNFRAALDWVRRTSESAHRGVRIKGQPEPVDIGLRLVVALYRSWAARGYYTEGKSQLSSILALDTALAGQADRMSLRAEAILGEAMLAVRRGQPAVADSKVRQALAIYGELGDRRGIARARLLEFTADAERRISFLLESLAVLRETGDKVDIAGALYQLASMAHRQGKVAEARRYFTESLEISEQEGTVGMDALILQSFAYAEVEAGNYETAGAYRERSLATYRELRDKWGIAIALLSVVDTAWIQGNATGLRHFVEEAQAIARDADLPGQVAVSLLDLGRMALIEGHHTEARRMLEESRDVSQKHLEDEPLDVWRFLGYLAEGEGDGRMALEMYKESLSNAGRANSGKEPPNPGAKAKYAALALAGIVGVEDEARTKEQTARLLGAAQALKEASRWPLHYDERIEYERSLAAARARLGDEADWQSAWEEGRAMSMEQAIAYALGEI